MNNILRKMMMLKSLALPARVFVYLSALSVILYLVQSGSFMGMSVVRTLVGKIIMIALWAYILNLVAKSGGVSFGVAWIFSLAPFIPSGLGFFF